MATEIFKILLILICGVVLVTVGANGSQLVDEKLDSTIATDASTEVVTGEVIIEGEIKHIESLFENMDTPHETSILSLVDSQDLYIDSIVEALEELTRLVQDIDNASLFLKHQGIFRVISPNLINENDQVKSKLMILLRTLFEVSPEYTKALTPKNVVDKLMDIFENDIDVMHKEEALDVLAKWLPNNPKIQTRIMKIKGFVPFYNQINKLQPKSVILLINLLNNIIAENLAARDDKLPKTTRNVERRRAYEKIGLIEHMSTSRVCHGLANVLDMLWSGDSTDNTTVRTVLESVKVIKSFCLDLFKNKRTAIDLLEAIHEYVHADGKRGDIQAMGLNLTEYQHIVNEYVQVLRPYKLKTEL